MRVRDIVRDSFAAATAAGVLLPHEPSGRFVPPPERHGAVWRPTQLKAVHWGATEGPLYRDLSAWRRAFAFVRAFTASAAAREATPRYAVDACFGSFGPVPPADAFHHLESALESCGLKRMSANAILQEGWFEATDSPRIEALPEPYGKWLEHQERQPRW